MSDSDEAPKPAVPQGGGNAAPGRRWQKGQSGNPMGPALAVPRSPKRRFSMAQSMDAAISALGSQVATLRKTAEERGLAGRERDWLLAVVDRLAMIEAQRGRLMLGFLGIEGLTPGQRDKIIAALTGDAPTIEAVPESQPATK